MKKNCRLNIRLEAKELGRLKAVAKSMNTTMSEALRRLVSDWYEVNGKERKRRN